MDPLWRQRAQWLFIRFGYVKPSLFMDYIRDNFVLLGLEENLFLSEVNGYIAVWLKSSTTSFDDFLFVKKGLAGN